MAKLTPEILDGIGAAFEQAGGVDYLTELGMRDPQTFCLLLGTVVKAEVKAAQPATTNTLDLGKALAEADARLIAMSEKP
jgi:hypothetical protein